MNGNDEHGRDESATVLAPAAGPLRGTVRVPGDKSQCHRALILGSLVTPPGLTVRHLSHGEDVRSTAACLRALGVPIREDAAAQTWHVAAPREWGAAPPGTPPELNCGNSGTTMRLLMGLLAGLDGANRVTLTGDASLRRRPMRRVAEPLQAMGAHLDLHGGDDSSRAPITVHPRRPLAAVRDYTLPVPSAQVKSALILAALAADGPSRLVDPFATRDHTERMLRWLEPLQPAVHVTQDTSGSDVLHVEPRLGGLHTNDTEPLEISGDPSAAAFWLVAASLVPESELVLPGVGTNPRRTGALEVLRRMGADVVLRQPGERGGEPVADWHVRQAPLHAVEVAPAEVPALIDEVPVLAVAAAAAHGTSRFHGLAELRHKESDRLAGTAALLQGLGVEAQIEPPDTLLVHGRATTAPPFRGNPPEAPLATHGDHRLAMAAAVAALAADGPVYVDSLASTRISDPTFLETRQAFSHP